MIFLLARRVANEEKREEQKYRFIISRAADGSGRDLAKPTKHRHRACNANEGLRQRAAKRKLL